LEQFRELAKWVAQAVHIPKRKSRRTEDTTGAFRMSARRTTRRDKIKAIYAHLVDRIVVVWDAVDWLRLWEPSAHESDMAGVDLDRDATAGEFDHGFPPPETDRQSSGLFPEP
jgi:hypothetical protein